MQLALVAIKVEASQTTDVLCDTRQQVAVMGLRSNVKSDLHGLASRLVHPKPNPQAKRLVAGGKVRITLA